MSYAQQQYPQGLGNSQTVSIAEAGCLLTAICNGLQYMNGSGPDPLALNDYYRNNGIYTWDAADQAADDLAWDSISRYDPTIHVDQVGVGSVPPSNNAIVKFHYNSVHTGNPIDHYTWVDHIEGNQVFIVDSWDGQVKGPSGYQNIYHLPVAWATYSKTAPTPPAPAAPLYTVTETYPEGKQVKLNKQPTNLWGMNYQFDYMKDHPVEVHNAGEVWAVTNKVHHVNGYDYYRREGQIDGFNVLDCDEIIAVPYKPPTGAVTVPTNLDPYALVVDVAGYSSANDAANHINPKITVPNGQYMKFTEKYGMVNVTQVQGKPGSWINPADNVVPPPPAPEPVKPSEYISPREPSVKPVPVPVVPPEVDTSWKATFTSFYPNSRKPIRYIFLEDFELVDLGGSGNPMHCGKYGEVSLYGTFVKDGVTYGRPKRRDDTYFKFYYGIPLTSPDGSDPGIVEPEQKVFDPSTTISERKNFKTLTLHDREVLVVATIEKVLEPAFKMIDGVFKRPTKK
jgi:hypothetical protein